MTFPQQISAHLKTALQALSLEAQPTITSSQDPKFGDYQTNVAMVTAKQRKTNPRALAQEIIDALGETPLSDICAPPEIAGPGFINFRLLDPALAVHTTALLSDPHLGVPQTDSPQRIVVDFSAPNVAKPMHIGHLRSTIIGDSLARTAKFLGHHVITDNHIGDWGTQFGMILYGWKNLLDQAELEKDPITELVRVYKEINAKAKEDEALKDTCKAELVKLQAGDEENVAIWQQCIDHSLKGLREIYSWLDIHFDHYLGESAYNDRLAPLVESLLSQEIAKISEGAACVFFPENKALEEHPCIIRKGDGGFLYSTTDLATIDYRIEEFKADQIWYVVGAPQSLHFQQIFETSKKRGQTVKLVHVAHGSILGEDRKLMRTRSGESVGLLDVLHESVERAKKAIEDKNPDLQGEEKEKTSKIVGLGAVKYSELSQHRMTDYIFNWDKMLALTGSTAPYLQYSYVRIQSIFRKLDSTPDLSSQEITLNEQAERTLAMKLAAFGETVPDVLNDFRPNILATYLFELAKAFHSFFEACPVLTAESEELKLSRLALAHQTGRTLKTGLDLLGIEVPERM